MRTDSSLCLVVRESDLGELDRIFCDATFEQMPPLIRKWGAVGTPAQLREAQSDMLASLVNEACTGDVGRDLSNPSPLSVPLKGRLIEIGGHRFLATLHMRNQTHEPPFVLIGRSTLPPGTMEDWCALKHRVLTEYKAFAPSAILFFHPSHLPLVARTSGIDDHLLAAPARLIADRTPITGVDRIDLKPAADLGFYPRYQALYEAAYAERPILRGEVRTETEDSLAFCLKEGFLFEIFADGKWAGIVAAKWRTLVGIHGVFMVEIVLSPSTRGQRLGPAVHQAFARAVTEAEPGAVIIGTISDKNPWSLQTALRAGRIEVGAWHWVDL